VCVRESVFDEDKGEKIGWKVERKNRDVGKQIR
jgi:hypothetical protein